MPKKKSTSTSASKSKSTRKPASSQSSKKKQNPPAKKAAKKPEKPIVTTEYDQGIPAHILFGCVCFVLSLLLFIVVLNPEPVLPNQVYNLMTGLLGKAGLYFLIPALLYAAVVNLWGKVPAKKSRTACTFAFVFFVGCIYHLAVSSWDYATLPDLIPTLYRSGITGISGGVICGCVAALLDWSCGSVVSYILIGLGTALTLLGAVQLTIPSLIRAIRGRPRDDWEDEEQEDVYVEPAARIVNKITEKQIESRKKKRQQQTALKAEKAYDFESDLDNEDYSFVPGKKPAPVLPSADPTAGKPASRKTAPARPALTAPQTASIPDFIPAASSASPDQENRPRYRNSIFQTMQGIDDDVPTAAPVRVSVTEPDEYDFISQAAAEPEEPDVPEVYAAPEEEPEYEPPQPPVRQKAVPVKTTVRKRPAAVEPEERPAARAEIPGKISAKDAQEAAFDVADEIAQNTGPVNEYVYPPIDLLNMPSGGRSDGSSEIRENTERLNKTLESFHIDARIIAVTRGPSVTRYEVRLSEGVKLSKLVNCADDIALSLGASGVRIAAIPGKISIVGIEVPNRDVTMVPLREVIDSDAFRKAKSKSSFAVGKNIADQCVVGNIAKMPHMLIAGTTGSGKSVCMNSIIISLLYKAGPEDVKLIMVDPKMVELGIYNGIPHLLIPVVTDPKKAAGSLQWAVTEMLRRYKMMSEVGVRDLASYNQEVMETENGQKLPQIVIIIDELADLMLVAAKEVEDSICRIAQMGRAAGMHLIIATQRPSADVITGLMKANIPSRIAFAVASAMESRIILDTMGADKLVGKGDMLYAPIGEGKPLRVQGCFVSDPEVERVAKFVKSHSQTEYDASVQDAVDKNAQQTGKGPKNTATASDPSPSAEELEGDEMLPAAVDVILETGQASVSMLQRRLKLGYARAARIVDEMEEKGLVGPFQGSKPRAILVTKEQWAAMRGSSDQIPD